MKQGVNRENKSPDFDFSQVPLHSPKCFMFIPQMSAESSSPPAVLKGGEIPLAFLIVSP